MIWRLPLILFLILPQLAARPHCPACTMDSESNSCLRCAAAESHTRQCCQAEHNNDEPLACCCDQPGESTPAVPSTNADDVPLLAAQPAPAWLGDVEFSSEALTCPAALVRVGWRTHNLRQALLCVWRN